MIGSKTSRINPIIRFYRFTSSSIILPSITEDLLDRAILWAKSLTPITDEDIRELKQATFLSARTSTGSKPRRYRWRMMASAVLV